SRSTFSSAFVSTPRRENHFSTPRAWISGGCPTLEASNSDRSFTSFIMSMRIAFPLSIEGWNGLEPFGGPHILAGFLAFSERPVQAAAQMHNAEIAMGEVLIATGVLDRTEAIEDRQILRLDRVLGRPILGPPLEAPPQPVPASHASALDVAEECAVLIDRGGDHGHAHDAAGGPIREVDPEQRRQPKFGRRLLGHLAVEHPALRQVEAFVKILDFE